MEVADPYSPVRGLVEDDDDKPTTSSLVELEDFPEDFKKYSSRNLNFSRLEDDGVVGWVFWSREDDRPNRSLVSDCENLNFVPNSNPKLEDRIRLALGRIILHPRCGQSLVQFWVATKVEGRTLLTTQNQPFALGKIGRSTWGLFDYRMKSTEYKFYGDSGECGEEELGLPGRVFLHRLPESAPDVQYYSLKEYPQRNDASSCHVRASWALPVLEKSSQICVGVLELVSSTDAITDWYDKDKAFLHYLNSIFQVNLGNYETSAEKKIIADARALAMTFPQRYENPLCYYTWTKDWYIIGRPLSLLPLLESCFCKTKSIHDTSCFMWYRCYHVILLLSSELSLEPVDPYKHYEMKSKDEDEAALTTALDELTSVVESVYKIHKLPLALAWVPCSTCDVLLLGQLSSEAGEYLGDFEANDSHLIDFFRVSTGYHLQKGHVAERTLSSPNMLYCSDVTQFNIAEYPMVPFARQCKLSRWFTMCLHNSYTGEHKYILEFFLPTSRIENETTPTTMCMILGTMKAHSKTFKLASGKELGELLSVEVFDFQNGHRHQDVLSVQASLELVKDGGMTLQLVHLDQQSFDANEMDVISIEQDEFVPIFSEGGTTKTKERKHKKTGVRFDISLEDVLQFSASSRKEAAKELKVSESTLKRICRRYGIDRWPPRKIKKEEEFPTALPNVGEIVHLDSLEEPSHLDSLEEPSVMELDALMIGKQDVGTDNSMSSISHLENESLFTIEDPQRHFGHKRKDPVESLGVSKSAVKRICMDHGITQKPNLQVSASKPLHDGGGKMPLDLPLMDAVNNGRSFISAEHNVSEVTCSGEGTNKTQGRTGVRIQISIEDILRCSGMKLEDAASELKVSSSTLKRVCREYNIGRWPPRNINKVDSLLPRVEHQGGISSLTSDMPFNQVSDRKDSINLPTPHDKNKAGSPRPLRVEHPEGVSELTYDTLSNQISTFQEIKTVTIRAKYDVYTIKFQLSMSPELVELQQEVAKRLSLEAGTYDITYQDDDGEVILIACNDDLKDCINVFKSLGKNTVVVLTRRPMTHS